MEEQLASIEKMADDLSPISRASAPAFFTEKVVRRLQQPPEPATVWYQWILVKPALVTATLLFFFLMNCWIIKSSYSSSSNFSSDTTSQLQQLSVDLNITSENNLPYK